VIVIHRCSAATSISLIGALTTSELVSARGLIRATLSAKRAQFLADIALSTATQGLSLRLAIGADQIGFRKPLGIRVVANADRLQDTVIAAAVSRDERLKY
tara:strand:+ start:2933 stop:3235 length:303 start_codon:yes stop_codon:yes gene_type:complete